MQKTAMIQKYNKTDTQCLELWFIFTWDKNKRDYLTNWMFNLLVTG